MSTERGYAPPSKFLKTLLPIAGVTLLPALLTIELYEKLCTCAEARAWDGTGHYALAQIYDQTLFPETFGWTHAYFGGMPFPNFYPPAFYWCVALLHHTGLFSFDAAFKLVLMLPVLLLPAAIWLLALKSSGGNRLVATCAALALIPLLVDHRLLHPVGLGSAGTFLIGLYTQPLGFVLLIAWYAVYAHKRPRPWRFA